MLVRTNVVSHIVTLELVFLPRDIRLNRKARAKTP